MLSKPGGARTGVCAWLLLGLVVGMGAGCKTSRGSGQPSAQQSTIVHEDAALEIDVGSETARVKAEWTWDTKTPPGPVVLVPPGGGNVSRRGTRTSDGVRAYARPVDVTRALARSLAARGFAVLSWDKRTCGPRDTPICDRYPAGDLDVEGPAALVKDLDAACELALSSDLGDGRVVLWAHGQATQIALSSSCAARAEAVVLVAPIPRRVDKVMVASLWARAEAAHKVAQKTGAEDDAARALDLKNRTGSRDAMFKAMEKGQFPEDARVLGATLAFWKAWIELTGRVPGERPAPSVPWIVALGARDTQYGPTDRRRIEAWGEHGKIEVVVVEGADHHLLVDGGWQDDALDPVLDRLEERLLGDAPSS